MAFRGSSNLLDGEMLVATYYSKCSVNMVYLYTYTSYRLADSIFLLLETLLSDIEATGRTSRD